MSASWRVEVHVSDALACFINARRRPQSMTLAWHADDDLKHRIEALGIPHTEVGAIYTGTEPHSWSWTPPAGAHLQLQAYAEALPAARALLHPPLPAAPAFAADVHLGRLTGYLRLFGFDTVLPPEAGDAALAEHAAREGRVLLTRDRSLLMHRVVAHGAYVRAQRPREQLVEVVCRYGLVGRSAPFTRCLRCNGVLQAVDKAAVADALPPQVVRRHASFRRCTGCGRVYWPGTHYLRLAAWVQEVQARVAKRAGCP